jgi:hypothetical protein
VTDMAVVEAAVAVMSGSGAQWQQGAPGRPSSASGRATASIVLNPVAVT